MPLCAQEGQEGVHHAGCRQGAHAMLGQDGNLWNVGQQQGHPVVAP